VERQVVPYQCHRPCEVAGVPEYHFVIKGEIAFVQAEITIPDGETFEFESMLDDRLTLRE
jgi:hypothetical protein